MSRLEALILKRHRKVDPLAKFTGLYDNSGNNGILK